MCNYPAQANSTDPTFLICNKSGCKSFKTGNIGEKASVNMTGGADSIVYVNSQLTQTLVPPVAPVAKLMRQIHQLYLAILVAPLQYQAYKFGFDFCQIKKQLKIFC